MKKVCIVNCFDTYEQRVDLLHDYFIKHGYETVVYTSDYRHFEKCQRTDSKPDFKYIHAIPYKKNISVSRIRSHAELAKSIFSETAKYDFDIVWVLVPPNSFIKEALEYKKIHKNTKLIFDLMDLWPETMPMSGLKALPPFVYWRNLRDKYLDAADYVVTECNLYQQKLPENVKNKLRTIYLAREIGEFHLSTNLPENKISLCYLGSINNIIDISVIAELIQGIKKYKDVELHIIGDGEKRDNLVATCKDAGAEVFYHGKIYDKDKKKAILDSCHYGLNIMKDSVFVGLTMKSMDYFEAGLPIINNIHGDTWDIVEKNMIGFNVEGKCSEADYQEIVDYRPQMRTETRRFFEDNLGIEHFEEELDGLFG